MSVATTTIGPPAAAGVGVRPDDHVMVLFGATGDLAKRKLIPGLFHLHVAGMLPAGFRLVATATSPIDTAEMRARARAACEEFARIQVDDGLWRAFEAVVSYVAVGGESDGSGARLAEVVRAATADLGGRARLLHYLSVPPVASAPIVRMLGATGLNHRARVIMEKPFGTDLASAQALNDTVHEVFAEEEVFRIDHFLGKETVQNILAMRFANGLFEPIWNRDHIAHVQIDVPETLSIGTRAGFYERTGAFRDMVVTHLFQVLAFVAMEPPTSLDAKTLVAEKTKVFEALRELEPEDVVRGQYVGYLAEAGVAPQSTTETFVALRTHVDNWRWSDVPFYLRTGKRLAEARRVVTLTLREPPRNMFPAGAYSKTSGPNTIAVNLAEPGSITANFMAKQPGATMALGSGHMRFDYADSFNIAKQLEAYERLILDAMTGDRTLFNRSEGIERLWEISARPLEQPTRVYPYPAGSWGPDAIHEFIAPATWQLPDDAGGA